MVLGLNSFGFLGGEERLIDGLLLLVVRCVMLVMSCLWIGLV